MSYLDRIPVQATPESDFLTTEAILSVLGPFDTRPGLRLGALASGWRGRVALDLLGMDGDVAADWLRCLIDHGTGTAMIPAETDAEWFAECVWEGATAALFLRGHLVRTIEKRALVAPVVVVAYGVEDAWQLERSGLPGRIIAGTAVKAAHRKPATIIGRMPALA